MGGALPAGRAPGTIDFNQFDTVYDFHYDGPVVTHYMICSTPRSGSHYLGHLMYSTGAMGYPLEYFHKEHFHKWTHFSGSESPEEVVQYIKRRRTTPNGCFGFKAHFSQFAAFARFPAFDILFPRCRFILIEREDLLAQAVSYVRAQQTGQWISMHQQRRKPWYDFRAIHRAILNLLEEKMSWLHFFAETGRPHMFITYESLLKEPDAKVNLVASYLNIEPVRIRADRVLPERQATGESDQWRERYLKEAMDRGYNDLLEGARLVETTGKKALIRELVHRVIHGGGRTGGGFRPSARSAGSSTR